MSPLLELVWGRSGSGKTRYILSGIREHIEHGHRNIIWLVPEPFTHECERLLAKECGAKASLHAEVLSFNRIADRVLAREGGLSYPVLDEPGRLLTMRLAVDAAREKLSFWQSAAGKPGFLNSLLNTIDECKCYGITPEHLSCASEQAKNASARKLSDLALIFAQYNALLRNGALDPRDRIALLGQKLRQGSFCEGVWLYADSFVTFTPQEAGILDVFINRAEKVTVALCGLPDEDFFSVTHRTAARLSRSVRNAVQTVLSGAGTHRTAVLSAIEEHLFDDDDVTVNGGDSVELFCACTLPDECLFAAHKMASLAGQGFRWRDMAVIVPSVDEYKAQLTLAFELQGVPAFFDIMEPVTSNPLITVLDSINAIISGDWMLEDIMRLMRTGLVKTGHNRLDRLEGYLRRWNIHGKQWTKPFDFHPRGFEKTLTPGDNRMLYSVNMFRTKLVEGLRPFRGKASSREWYDRYAGFIQTFSVDKALEKRAKMLESNGHAAAADKYRQIWDILRNVFCQMDLILGERKYSLEDFSGLLRLTLSVCEAGTIPVYLDNAVVGEAGRLRRTSARAVFCLGCSEENMPGHTQPESLLSAEEREFLGELDIELPPDGEQRAEREFFNIYTSFTLPSEKLILSLCREPDGKISPAGALIRICAIAGKDIQELPPVRRRKKAPPDIGGTLSRENVIALYSRKITLSAGRIERFSGCPFRFFCDYGLNLSEPAEAGLSPADVGVFAHEVLEGASRACAENPSLTSKDAAQMAAERYIKVYLKNLHTFSEQFKAVFLHIADSVVNAAEILLEDLRQSEFKALRHEMRFSAQMPPPDAEFSAELRGVIDRVDIWSTPEKHFLRVIDYKTGQASFPLAEISQGLKMQMPLYLFTLLDPKNRKLLSPEVGYDRQIVPAAILYLPASDKLVVSDRRLSDKDARMLKSVKYSGLLLNDERVLAAMGTAKDKPSPRYPVKWNKDGSFSKSSMVADMEQWNTLRELVETKVKETARRIIGGEVEENPGKLSDPCEHCGYKSACRYDTIR